MNEREIVLDILMEVMEGGHFSHLVLRDTLEKYQFIDKRKRAFITRVTEGTLEHLIEIDYMINQFSKVKVKKMKPIIRNVIRSAVYQMKYLDSVPNSAICNEAVKLVVKRGFGGLKGFVNGVLRNMMRDLDHIKWPTRDNPVLYYSIQYSLPEWLVQLWLEQYGANMIEKVGPRFQLETGTTIRVNTTNIQKEALIKKLEKEGVIVREHPYISSALKISGYDSLQFLDSFQEGDFQVQDISSMLVGEIAAPAAHNFIIDVCAAPGGKSLHLADKLNGTGTVEARDLTDYKIQLIQDNINRTEMSNVRVVKWDATVLDTNAIEKADIVIADLPCSGLGVLGKKTDLKYKLQPESLQELAQLQRQMLEQVVQYVKPGGKLLYSTCTINRDENEKNAKYIETLGMKGMNIMENLCQELQMSVVGENKNMIQLVPGIHDADGFFIAGFYKE